VEGELYFALGLAVEDFEAGFADYDFDIIGAHHYNF
jgi:hypothetical protein